MNFLKSCNIVVHIYYVTFHPNQESSRVSISWHSCVCVCPWTYVHVRAWKPEVSIRHLSSLLYSLLFLREGLSLNLRVQPSCDIPLFQLSSDICSHKYNLWTYRKQAFPISFLILGTKVDRFVYMMDIGSNQHHSLSHPTVLPKFPCSYGMLGLKKKKTLIFWSWHWKHIL